MGLDSRLGEHLAEHCMFLELELGCVSNSTTCSINSTAELLRDEVGGTELQKRERSSPKHLLNNGLESKF
jgi:hypothetical protein